MPYRLSPSAINLIKECPRCFWLTQHKVWKRPSGIFPSLPSGMDKILKIHFDNFMKKDLLPPELCENGHCKNMKIFNDPEKMKIWQSNFKGISFTDKDGNELHGAVDNILVKMAEKAWKDALKLLKGDCPTKCCEWCEGK
jgi:hypothetical protein